MWMPTGSARAETLVRGSRFIAETRPVESRDDIKEIVRKLREEYQDATHVIWAFILGRDRAVFGYSDDHEPKGTAGRPVFEVLKGSGLSNTGLAVVRYFGGTKLGTGGLSRAYSDAARAVLDITPRALMRDMAEISVRLEYSVYERLCSELVRSQGEVLGTDFGEEVHLRLKLPKDSLDTCLEDIRDLSSGKAVIEFID